MDGLFGKEVKTFLKKLSSLLAKKWEKTYSKVCGYVNAQMSIAVVRATHTSKMSKGRIKLILDYFATNLLTRHSSNLYSLIHLITFCPSL
jgi:hypothetical protein